MPDSDRARDVPEELLARTRHVHAASFFLMPRLAGALAGVFARARGLGATTSLDTNDDPSGRWDPELLDPVLTVTDQVLPNAAEARALTGVAKGVAEAAAALARRGPLVVVKNGAEGALAHDGTRVTTAPALPVEPLDTVGAGDSFDAGFVAAVLRGLGLADALAVAAACGSLSTRGRGGTAAQPTWTRPSPAFPASATPRSRGLRMTEPTTTDTSTRTTGVTEMAEPAEVKIAFMGAGSVVFTQGLLADLFAFPSSPGCGSRCTTSTPSGWRPARRRPGTSRGR